jgi:hypothetical protein
MMVRRTMARPHSGEPQAVTTVFCLLPGRFLLARFMR